MEVVLAAALVVVMYAAWQDAESFTWFSIASGAELQTVMFLQLVSGGHLLLFITRSEGWFFQRPYPAPILFWAITATQVIAILMCAFGWLVEPISWAMIGLVCLYDVIWMFILNFINLVANKMINHRSKEHLRNIATVNKKLNAA